jgi:hypothetical protein
MLITAMDLDARWLNGWADRNTDVSKTWNNELLNQVHNSVQAFCGGSCK